MAILFVREIWDGRTGQFSLGNERVYVRRHEVRFDTAQEAERVVLTSPGVPRPGELYLANLAAGEFDLTAVCRTTKAEQDSDDYRVWFVTSEYTNKIPYNPGTFVENPLARPALLDWDFAEYERAVFRDLRGRSLTNSANAPYSPVPTAEDSRLVLKYTRNEAVYNLTFAVAYKDAVNSDIFLGLPPRTAKLHRLSGREDWENGVRFYQVSKELHFRRETFDYFLLDQGPHYLDANDKPLRFPDGYGGWLETGLLNGMGGRLTESFTTLVANVTAAATTFEVDDPTVFPGPPGDLLEYAVKVGDEVMGVVDLDIVTGIITVARGYAGTTAATHNASDVISLQAVYNLYQMHKQLPFNVLDILI